VPAANPDKIMSSIIRIRNGDILALLRLNGDRANNPIPQRRPSQFGPVAARTLPSAKPSVQQELKDRIMAAMDFFNQEPIIHTWTYKLDTAA
jgi:hypothetical protein